MGKPIHNSRGCQKLKNWQAQQLPTPTLHKNSSKFGFVPFRNTLPLPCFLVFDDAVSTHLSWPSLGPLCDWDEGCSQGSNRCESDWAIEPSYRRHDQQQESWWTQKTQKSLRATQFYSVLVLSKNRFTLLKNYSRKKTLFHCPQKMTSYKTDWQQAARTETHNTNFCKFGWNHYKKRLIWPWSRAFRLKWYRI